MPCHDGIGYMNLWPWRPNKNPQRSTWNFVSVHTCHEVLQLSNESRCRMITPHQRVHCVKRVKEAWKVSPLLRKANRKLYRELVALSWLPLGYTQSYICIYKNICFTKWTQNGEPAQRARSPNTLWIGPAVSPEWLMDAFHVPQGWCHSVIEYSIGPPECTGCYNT